MELIKSYSAILMILLLSACAKETKLQEPEFELFSNETTLKFEYYYDWEEEDEQWPIEELELKVEDVEIEDQTYTGFKNLNEPKPAFDLHKETGVLDFNFVPIRYENGNYYARRGIREIVILKDNIELGDIWTEEFVNDDGTPVNYALEVIALHEIYDEFGIEYENVFQIKETLEYPNITIDQTAMHYYNKEIGIIRKEIPQYISGTYGPITFNRIQ